MFDEKRTSNHFSQGQVAQEAIRPARAIAGEPPQAHSPRYLFPRPPAHLGRPPQRISAEVPAGLSALHRTPRNPSPPIDALNSSVGVWNLFCGIFRIFSSPLKNPIRTLLDKSKELGKIPCMTQSTLTSKNQTTIPKAVIEVLNLRPSDQLVYEIEEDGRIILTAKTGTFASVAASLSRKAKPGRTRSVDEMKAAVKAMARKRHLRSKS